MSLPVHSSLPTSTISASSSSAASSSSSSSKSSLWLFRLTHVRLAFALLLAFVLSFAAAARRTRILTQELKVYYLRQDATTTTTAATSAVNSLDLTTGTSSNVLVDVKALAQEQAQERLLDATVQRNHETATVVHQDEEVGAGKAAGAAATSGSSAAHENKKPTTIDPPAITDDLVAITTATPEADATVNEKNPTNIISQATHTTKKTPLFQNQVQQELQKHQQKAQPTDSSTNRSNDTQNAANNDAPINVPNQQSSLSSSSTPDAATVDAASKANKQDEISTTTITTNTTIISMKEWSQFRNLHQNFPTQCGQLPSHQQLHPSILAMTHLFFHNRSYTPGYTPFMYTEGATHGIKGLDNVLKTQVCLYDSLIQFRALAQRLGITQWAVHGGSAMSAQCFGAIAPWDDDIDMTVANCSALDALWDASPMGPHEIVAAHPDIPYERIARDQKPLWIPKLIDVKRGLVLSKGFYPTPWYKFYTLTTARQPTPTVTGMDIECLDRATSRREQRPKQQSGWLDYLMKRGGNNNKPLEDVMYGPTKIQMLPADIHAAYVQLRYNKLSPCRYPYENGLEPELFPMESLSLSSSSSKHNRRKQTNDDTELLYLSDIRTSSMDTAMALWYVPHQQRDAWRRLAGNGNQQDYTNQIPNLNRVEIDNSIAPTSSSSSSSSSSSQCQFHTNASIKVIGWTADRGLHWDQLVHKIHELDALRDPYVIVLNSMDVGMARSGNIHTVRRLAMKLGMNYAFAVEFMELTRGTLQEQNATEGMRDAMSLMGNAILTKCYIGGDDDNNSEKNNDVMVLRDPLPGAFFAKDQPEIRLGGHLGLFVRIYQEKPSSTTATTTNDPIAERPPHFVVGSVHKLNENSPEHRAALWKFFAFGDPPPINPGVDHDNPTTLSLRVGDSNDPAGKNQLGVVLQGDFAAQFCRMAGLEKKNKNERRHRTFPAQCSPKVHIGHIKGDFVCSNMGNEGDLVVTPPCFVSQNVDSTNGNDNGHETLKNIVTAKMSDHAIVSIVLKIR